MKTQVSEKPDLDAGAHITQILAEHAHERILLLLSGGSAFSILPFIVPDVLGEHVTVCMTDERFTTLPSGNNFLQLQNTQFYIEAKVRGVAFIESVPQTDESHKDFTERIELMLRTYMYENLNSFTLGIFGIGEDGHTAGIFPAPKEAFETVFKTDQFFVDIIQPRDTYQSRSTVTPTFIDELDNIVLYAVGSNKCENILDYMYNRIFERHEVPALIPASHPQSILFTDCPTLIP